MLNENEIIIHKNQTDMMDFMEDILFWQELSNNWV